MSDVLPSRFAPRMAVRMFVPAAGSPSARVAQEPTDEVFQFDLRPYKMSLVSNNYLQADECNFTCPYDEAGIDPRFLRSAEVYAYVYDEGKFEGDYLQDYRNCRFVGIVRSVDRQFSESTGKVLHVRALDYTTLFLEATSFPSDGIPPFTDTIQEAWDRICDNTGYWDMDQNELVSSVQNLKGDHLVGLGVDLSRRLGDAVPSRVAASGILQGNHAADAWAVWQNVVGSLGLISYIRNDRCIVTTATDYYTADDPPRFVWGQNILDFTESRDLGTLSNKHVAVRSYDPLGGKTLESLFPDPSSPLALRKKKLGASASRKASKTPRTLHTQDYEAFDLPFAVADQKTLDAIAERIWQERTRQELKGSLKTLEMSVATVQGASLFDLTTLAAGDQIQVEIERDALDQIQGLATVSERTLALLARGYQEQVAFFVAKNLDAVTSLLPQFLVHSCTIDIDAAGSAAQEGTYSMSIEYVNRLDVSGVAANEADGTRQPPLQDQRPR